MTSYTIYGHLYWDKDSIVVCLIGCRYKITNKLETAVRMNYDDITITKLVSILDWCDIDETKIFKLSGNDEFYFYANNKRLYQIPRNIKYIIQPEYIEINNLINSKYLIFRQLIEQNTLVKDIIDVIFIDLVNCVRFVPFYQINMF